MDLHNVNHEEYKNMKIGPKYKIARRLGAAVFEKTQTAKFALSEQKKQKQQKRGKGGSMSNFGKQLLEKQKVRFTYGISEKQLNRYVKEAIKQNPSGTSSALFGRLERRLDSLVLRAGFASSRLAARQMVSHGHIMVNGKRNKVPSYKVTLSDKITIRPGSVEKGLFTELDEKISEKTIPAWIALDKTKKEISLKGEPVYNKAESAFLLPSVVQYYKR